MSSFTADLLSTKTNTNTNWKDMKTSQNTVEQKNANNKLVKRTPEKNSKRDSNEEIN